MQEPQSTGGLARDVWEINHKDIKLTQRLGKGMFGEVRNLDFQTRVSPPRCRDFIFLFFCVGLERCLERACRSCGQKDAPGDDGPRGVQTGGRSHEDAQTSQTRIALRCLLGITNAFFQKFYKKFDQKFFQTFNLATPFLAQKNL